MESMASMAAASQIVRPPPPPPPPPFIIPDDVSSAISAFRLRPSRSPTIRAPRSGHIPYQRRPSSIPTAAQGSPGTGALPHGLLSERLPRHVAIIMDGNSRWAQQRGLPTSQGHERGAIAVREVVKLSQEWGIHALTLFAFSSDNWFRPKVEVVFLISLFEKVLKEELPNFLKMNMRIQIIGELTRFPNSLQRLFNLVESRTKDNTGLKLTIAAGYSGRRDIILACQQLATEVEKGELRACDISESLLDNKLATSWIGQMKNPDLLIRTSGEQRLSNFLLWQLAHTEIFFTDACWPEFGETLYTNALLSFQQRERRFGRRSNVQS